MMPIDCLPDLEERMARQDAFWQREIIDRPVAHIAIPREKPLHPWPAPKGHHSLRDRWLDAEYSAECALAQVMNTEWLGDTVPNAWPNLGPEVFSAFFGCELEYTEDTSWAAPNLANWEEADKLRFSEDNFYWKKAVELAEAYLEIGRGRFYTAMTDLHVGGDAIAAFRDPQQLCLDLIESPDQVKRVLRYVTDVYLQVYHRFYDMLVKAQGAVGCNAFDIISTRKWGMGCNDFSYLISERMFNDIFLPEIVRECEHLEACCYHLDGTPALRHLDSLLAEPGITAIQWVPSVGDDPLTEWMHVYQRCQRAGKGLQIHVTPEQIGLLSEHLRPEGIWLWMEGVRDREQAGSVLEELCDWTRQ